MKNNILVFGSNTMPFIKAFQKKFKTQDRFVMDYVLIKHDGAVVQSNKLEEIYKENDAKIEMISKSDFAELNK